MLRIRFNDLRIALHEMGEMCRILSFIFLLPLVFTLHESNLSILTVSAFILPALIMYLLYVVFSRVKIKKTGRTKHIMIAVSLIWLIVAVVGSLPFYLSSTLNMVDSFFESMSGWTTTGMTMIENPGSVSDSVMFYRSLTQWVGGIGVVALALTVLRRRGTVAVEYYASEVGKQKLKPRMRSTVKETWKIYAIYTLACIVLLMLAGMNDPFDALNHSFTTLSTGGFSTYSDGIKHFNSITVELVLLLFMMVGSISFLIHLRIFEGRYDTLFKNIEVKYMLGILLLSSIIISARAYFLEPDIGFISTMRETVFHTVSALTCTGYSTENLDEWFQLPQTVLICLMYIGGVYGSTAGGIKLLRFIVILRAIKQNVMRMLLPKTAVLRIRIGETVVEDNEMLYILTLSIAYVIVSVIGCISLMEFGFTELQSIFLSLSAMGNVGLINLPADLWFSIPDASKLILAFLMWVGRLEIFPVLMLLTGFFKMKK